MVTAARQVTNSTASDQYDRVLLEIVADARNVGRRFHTVGQSDSGDLTKCRVRLLRGGRGDLRAHTALLGRAQVGGLILQRVEALLKDRRLGLVDLL